MPLRPADRNESKLLAWSQKHDMSQTEILNLVLDSVSDIIIEDLIVESKRSAGKVESKPLRFRKVATWG